MIVGLIDESDSLGPDHSVTIRTMNYLNYAFNMSLYIETGIRLRANLQKEQPECPVKCWRFCPLFPSWKNKGINIDVIHIHIYNI